MNAIAADAQDLPFANGEFDCVVANWSIHHFPDPDAGVREMGRVLRPEGRLVAATFSTEHMRRQGGDLRCSGRAAARPLRADLRGSKHALKLLGRHRHRE